MLLSILVSWITRFLIYSSISASMTPEYNETFVRSKSFIDKSDLLKIFFLRNMATHEFFTCPAGFGKTTNLKMIQKFSQIELNEKGAAKVYNETDAYDLFKSMKIGKCTHVINEHCAQHPVIFLDLHINFNGTITAAKVLNILSTVLRKSYTEYSISLGKYYENNGHICDPSAMLLSSKVLKNSLNETEIGLALFYLCRELFNCFGKKVVVLTDGLDHVINEAVTQSGDIDYYYKLLDNMFRRALNNTQYVYDLTLGITSLAHRHDRFREYIVHRRYTEYDPIISYFGVLPDELDDLFNRYKCAATERHFVQKYYSGYRTVDQHDLRYNTGEIMHYFRRRPEQPNSSQVSATISATSKFYLEPRKTVTSTWRFLKNPEYFDKVAKLIKHCTFRKKFKTKYDYDHYDTYLELIKNDFNDTRYSHAIILYTYTIEHGIFAPISMTTYVIANQVKRNLLITDLQYYFNVYLRIDLKLISCILYRILHEDLDRAINLQSHLEQVLQSAFEKIKFQPEQYYCTFEFVLHSVLHVAALTGEKLKVDEDYPRRLKSNREQERFQENPTQRCVTLVWNDESALVIKITLNQSTNMALQKALKYSYSKPGIRHVKYLAIDINNNNSIGLISYDPNRKYKSKSCESIINL